MSVSLAAVINTIKTQLTENGFRFANAIPAVNAQFVIFESADLHKAQKAFRVLDNLANVLPILALILAGIAVYISRSRRKALIATGLAIAVSMLLLGVALNVSRTLYLERDPVDGVAAGCARGLRHPGRVHPTQPASRARRWARRGDRRVAHGRLHLRGGATRRWFSLRLGSLRGQAGKAGIDPGPVGAFAYKYRSPLRVAIVSIAVLLYVASAHPTGRSTLVILAVMALALILLELVAAPPADDAPDPEAAAASTAGTP